MKRASVISILTATLMFFGASASASAQNNRPDVDCRPTDHCFPADGPPGHSNPVPPPQVHPPVPPVVIPPTPGPVTGPVETIPPCTWTKEKNGAFSCKANATVSVANSTAFSCSIFIYNATVRFERFSFSVEPKNPQGDRFAIYSIKTSVSTQGSPTFIAVDAQNEVKGPTGPLPVTGDYVCHIEMTIWQP